MAAACLCHVAVRYGWAHAAGVCEAAAMDYRGRRPSQSQSNVRGNLVLRSSLKSNAPAAAAGGMTRQASPHPATPRACVGRPGTRGRCQVGVTTSNTLKWAGRSITIETVHIA
eukprot:jgi/Ulvmu1/9659/UM054_0091.1